VCIKSDRNPIRTRAGGWPWCVVGVYPRTPENRCVQVDRFLDAQIARVFDQSPDGFATAKTEQIAPPPHHRPVRWRVRMGHLSGVFTGRGLRGTPDRTRLCLPALFPQRVVGRVLVAEANTHGRSSCQRRVKT